MQEFKVGDRVMLEGAILSIGPHTHEYGVRMRGDKGPIAIAVIRADADLIAAEYWTRAVEIEDILKEIS
ncbi:MAG: hypothetical protein ACYC0Z_16385 [Acidobacteriaceae bacterium]